MEVQSKTAKILLLGSGELGKEVALELMRLGAEVVACDSYENAPAMQVAHKSRVFSMLDPIALRTAVKEENPDLIVPEIESIATSELLALEETGYKVIPTAQAANYTMNREWIRKLAAEKLEIPTAKYKFADTFEELCLSAAEMGYPCVIKPIMSSSGKGQSVAHSESDLKGCWEESQTGGRTGKGRIIVEEFIDFASEITLLTVRSKQGTQFCDPIGHRQEGGDYVESWQPHQMPRQQISAAQRIALKMTEHLGGYGVFGVELFLLKDGQVIFSEVSPRPHDTGMVTMATQKLSQFALHARAILGYPIPCITRYEAGASVAVKNGDKRIEVPKYKGMDEAFKTPGIDLRIFGKPVATPFRRMGVILASSDNVEEALEKGKAAHSQISIV